ncbi:MAG: M48 family metallopeptidase [bacterium]|nr:M48 family metallopeptidase [bacterium]
MNWKICEKELIYRGICMVITILLYVVLLVCTLGLALLYALLLWLGIILSEAMILAGLKQNSVKLAPSQLPKIYNIVQEYSKMLEIDCPEVYISQSNGVLNAFATKYLKRNFVILNSDILTSVDEEDEEAVRFIIAHELAHIKRNHINRLWIFFGLIIPFLGTAYSRACETTCDNIATQLVGANSVNGLVLLAVGGKTYKKIDVQSIIMQSENSDGFFSWLSEILCTHPHLLKRIRNIESINN